MSIKNSPEDTIPGVEDEIPDQWWDRIGLRLEYWSTSHGTSRTFKCLAFIGMCEAQQITDSNLYIKIITTKAGFTANAHHLVFIVPIIVPL